MSGITLDLVRELVWRSSQRILILDSSGRIYLSSSSFRDSFPGMLVVRDRNCEELFLGNEHTTGDYLERLSGVSPGGEFTISLTADFFGEKREVTVKTTALESLWDGLVIFLTEWALKTEDSTGVSAAALDAVETKYRNLQENLPVGIYRAVQEGLLQTANSALIRMMGFDSFEELQNAKLKDVWVNTDQRSRLIEELREKGSVIGYPVKLRKKSGDVVMASFDARGTFDASGKLIHFDAIVQDITARVQAKEELEMLARTDSLTGLYNRQHLFRRLEDELKRVHRYGRDLSILLMDLDHFKRINDTHGHLAGDMVLVSTAETIMDNLREADFAGRYGGEEFCIVLPETPIRGAEELAVRLRKAVESKRNVLKDGTDIGITCCIGAAQSAGGDTEEIISSADAALYRAKDAGRNRVVCAGGKVGGK